MQQTARATVGSGEAVAGIEDDSEASSVTAPTTTRRLPGKAERELAARGLPRGDVGPRSRWFRHWLARTVVRTLTYAWFKVTVVHPERLPDGPCLYAFNHLSWIDPPLLLGSLPAEPRVHFYGPKQVDLRAGVRNRLMWWTGLPIPFSPGKQNLRTSMRQAQAVFGSGGAIAIAPEGTIHVHEGDLLAFEEGAAYLALRAGVPIVPIALTGMSAVFFRGRVHIRIGESIETAGVRPTRQNVARYSALTWHAIRSMVEGDRDLPRPGRIGRWLTDLFNDWGPGGREAAARLRGPDPAEVTIPPLETT